MHKIVLMDEVVSITDEARFYRGKALGAELETRGYVP
jgi:hypothetical protein